MKVNTPVRLRMARTLERENDKLWGEVNLLSEQLQSLRRKNRRLHEIASKRLDSIIALMKKNKELLKEIERLRETG